MCLCACVSKCVFVCMCVRACVRVCFLWCVRLYVCVSMCDCVCVAVCGGRCQWVSVGVGGCTVCVEGGTNEVRCVSSGSRDAIVYTTLECQIKIVITFSVEISVNTGSIYTQRLQITPLRLDVAVAWLRSCCCTSVTPLPPVNTG